MLLPTHLFVALLTDDHVTQYENRLLNVYLGALRGAIENLSPCDLRKMCTIKQKKPEEA